MSETDRNNRELQQMVNKDTADYRTGWEEPARKISERNVPGNEEVQAGCRVAEPIVGSQACSRGGDLLISFAENEMRCAGVFGHSKLYEVRTFSGRPIRFRSRHPD